MTTIRNILKAYAFLDETELGEDKFSGHYDIDTTEVALTALMEQARQKLLDELERQMVKDVYLDEHDLAAALDEFINGKRKKGDTDDKKEK